LITISIRLSTIDISLSSVSAASLSWVYMFRIQRTHAMRNALPLSLLVHPPSTPNPRMNTPFSLTPSTRVMYDPCRVGVVRQLTSSKPAAAPDTSASVASHLALSRVRYSPKNAEARAVTILTLSGVFLAMLLFFIIMMSITG
jgi:hypothetical protein